MDTPQTTHPHLLSISEGLGRSIQRHLADNQDIQAAFADLAFEVALARQFPASTPATPAFSDILEPTL